MKAVLLAAAFMSVAGAPFTASSARADSDAPRASTTLVDVRPVPPQASARLAVQNSTPVPMDSTPVPIQTSALAHASDRALKAQDNAPTHSQDGAQTRSQGIAEKQDSTPLTSSAPKQDAAPSQDAKQDGKPDSGKDTKHDDNAPAQAQSGAPAQGSTQGSTQGGAPGSTQANASSCPGNPNALGTSRVLAIDPADFKRIGRMQYPDSLPLQDKEVVITFDDGPLPPYSTQILNILASECVKVTYFLVGEMARAYPAVVRREYEEGHTIGTHSEHHPLHFGELPLERMRSEIDTGISDVGAALGDTKYLAPFFRLPGLDRSNLVEEELAARHLIVFSSDTVADDWRRISPDQIRSLALKRMQKLGKGILLLHDIHAKTAAALPGILKDLKDNGFRIVQVVPSASYEMAMLKKPMARMVASATPGQLKIGSGLDNAAARPVWPQPTTENLTPEVTALPAPDVSDFQPDNGVADDSASVQWPEEPKAAAAEAAADDDKPRAERSAEHARHRRHEADTDEHERHGRHHERERAGHDRHHRADLVTEIKSLAALFTPTH